MCACVFVCGIVGVYVCVYCGCVCVGGGWGVFLLRRMKTVEVSPQVGRQTMSRRIIDVLTALFCGMYFDSQVLNRPLSCTQHNDGLLFGC